ncbi:hypothetical protein N0V84_010055 [Fusarium piperis]|uniref:Mid2 domain-containing protein n=1 Tax=Fusarium piperis TaxID=1435070 RepID=A0A9W8W552_9HYPO|nr:hypothetical protein N0V84_010055 [Fusarium piperis]
MHSLLPFAVLLSSFTAKVLCDTKFTTPGSAGSDSWRNNPGFDVGESMNVEWETDLEETNLLLWQDYPRAGGGTQFVFQYRENTTSTSYIWKIGFDVFSTDVKKGEDAVFHWTLYAAGGTTDAVANSQAFNVTVPNNEPSTTTGTQLQTREASPTSATTSTDEPTSEPTEISMSDGSSLSTGAVAGIAVGATIGGLVAFGSLGFLLWRRLRKGPSTGTTTAAVEQEKAQAQPQQPQAGVTDYYKPPQAPMELSGQSWSPGQSEYARGPGGLHEAP